MGIRSGPLDRARRRIEDDLHRARTDLGLARRGAGLSLDAVGRACNVAGSTAQRIETGAIRNPDLVVFGRMAAAVGLELRIRAFPIGEPIRDASQQRLLERLRVQLPPTVRWGTEVPLPTDGDRRAWDAMLTGSGWIAAIDAETVLEDVQALERRLALKRRDGGIEHVILLVADTPRNRRALRSAPAAFGGFGRDARPVLRAVRRGDDPGASAIILL
jgi:transcriptional regulator with XRE-family HTH domain